MVKAGTLIPMLTERVRINENYDKDGNSLKASNVFQYLSNVFYNRRNKMNPLWNAVIVGGVENGKP